MKVFYIDEEDDEIFVDTDDEYKELLKIASQQNKVYTRLKSMRQYKILFRMEKQWFLSS